MANRFLRLIKIFTGPKRCGFGKGYYPIQYPIEPVIT